MLSKQNAIMLPGLIFIYELTVRKSRIFNHSIWLRTFAFAAMVIAYFTYTRYGLSHSHLGQAREFHEYWTHGLTQLKLHISHYGLNFIWPLNVMEGHYIKPATLMDPGPWFGFLLVLFTLYMAWRSRQSSPLISFGIMAYWIQIAPVASVIPIRMVADYRPYASSPFLYLIVGIIAFSSLKRKALIASCFALMVYLSAIAIYLNTTWKTEEGFWKRAVDSGQAESRAHLNYALAVNDMDLREKHLRKALEQSPHYILVKINLGLNLINKGQKEEGLDLMKKAVAQDPRIAQSQYWLGIAYKLVGKLAEAAEAAAMAANLYPLPKYQYQAGLLMQSTGRHKDSIPYLQAVQEYNPNYKRTGFLLGFSYQKAGQTLEAIKTYQAYVEKKPRDYQARFNLAYALMKQKQYRQAIQEFDKTLELKPDYAEVHLHLSTCYQGLGNTTEAARHLALWENRNR
jgi:tetratricopeptide (TPR) repeat protein